jgi:ubiquitin C-terminal hydrolase
MSVITNIRGFPNLGNTCYMNAAIQALLSSDILNNAILIYSAKHQDRVEKFSPVLIEYIRLILDFMTDNLSGSSYSPHRFKKIIDKENSYFRGYSQHCPSEFISYLVNEFAETAKDKGMAKLMNEVCFGKYKEYICCDVCRNVNIRYAPFLEIPLPIPDTPNPDLSDCFTKFATFETLDEKNRWTCPTCQMKVVAHKRIEIHEIPEVAIFTFNRFKNSQKNNTPIKIYPRIKLEKRYLRLIATINHYGSLNGGHYVAHVSRGDVWYRANDSTISKDNIDSILNDPSVFMVIYQVEYNVDEKMNNH